MIPDLKIDENNIYYVHLKKTDFNNVGLNF